MVSNSEKHAQTYIRAQHQTQTVTYPSCHLHNRIYRILISNSQKSTTSSL